MGKYDITKPIRFPLKKKQKTKKTDPEQMLSKQLYAAGFRGYRRNVQFMEGRKFEADFYFPRIRLVIEVDGGLWMKRGGHTTGAGALRDRERDMLAYIHEGILTLRVGSDHVKDGSAIEWLTTAIPKRRKEILGERG
jgi:very-short-patch-repair endonuclease